MFRCVRKWKWIGVRPLHNDVAATAANSVKPRLCLSKMLVPTLKETPSDAIVTSHSLMLRAGLIRQASSGIYTLLPLAQRALAKVEAIIDEEMQKIDGQKIRIPALSSAVLWKQTGRWDSTGPELFTVKDRRGRDFCLAPTCEESITKLVNDEVTSYKQLPMRLYQIEAKFRDELRPRFGLLRCREFVMKDMYSFDCSESDAIKSYELVCGAYKRIFERIGVDSMMVEADNGPIGGKFSHEFHVLGGNGESVLLHCSSCSYSSNQEQAKAVINSMLDEDSSTPSVMMPRHICESLRKGEYSSFVVEFVGEIPSKFAVVICPKGRKPNLAFVLTFGKFPVVLVDSSRASDILSSEKADILVFVDRHVPVDQGLEGNVFVGDFALAEAGDRCSNCTDGILKQSRGIEVGHIFNLGTKYSEAMQAVFADDKGRPTFFEMGCYGIGVSRLLAAVIEASNDDKGIVWPASIAPYKVLLLSNGQGDNDAEAVQLYDELQKEPLLNGEVVMDTRDRGLAYKFKDAELIGFPLVVVVGRDFQKLKMVELQRRKAGDSLKSSVHRNELVPAILQQLSQRR